MTKPQGIIQISYLQIARRRVLSTECVQLWGREVQTVGEQGSSEGHRAGDPEEDHRDPGRATGATPAAHEVIDTEPTWFSTRDYDGYDIRLVSILALIIGASEFRLCYSYASKRAYDKSEINANPTQRI